MFRVLYTEAHICWRVCLERRNPPKALTILSSLQKGFMKKQNISIAKTAVQVIFDESASQVIIPDSQGSVSSAKHTAVIEASDVKVQNQAYLTTPSNSQQSQQGERAQHCNKLVTPSRSRVSEASINIVISAEHKTVNSSALITTPLVGKGRIKPPLQMVNTAQRNPIPVSDFTGCQRKAATYKQVSTAADPETAQPNRRAPKLSRKGHDEQMDIVPDTQFPVGRNTPQMPGLSRAYSSINENSEVCQRKNKKTSVTNEFISNKDKLPAGGNVLAKQKALSSVTEGETQSAQNQSLMKMQPPGTRKRTKDGTTKTEEGNTGKLGRRNNRHIDTSLRAKGGKSEMNLLEDSSKKAKPDEGKKESSHVGKSKNSSDVSQRKESQTVKAKSLQDAAQMLIAKIESKYSKDAVGKKQDVAVWQNANKYTKQMTRKMKKQDKAKGKENRQPSSLKGGEPWNDIYSFHSAECDNPTIELGIQSTFLSKPTSITTPAKPESTEKKQTSNTVVKQKPRYHRHLFSDTDTDRGCDDSKTDISWLPDRSNIKKPQLVGYSRHKLMKPPEQTALCETEANLKQRRKPKRKEAAEDQRPELDEDQTHKQVGKQVARPRRAAVKRTCYKEVSNSELSSEEEPTIPVKHRTPTHQYELLAKKKQQSEDKFQKPEVITTKKHQNIGAKPKGSKAISSMEKPTLSPTLSSPGSIDRLRDESYPSDMGLPVTHTPTARLSPSPSPCSSSSDKRAPFSDSTAIKNASRHLATIRSTSTYRHGKEPSTHETSKETSSPVLSHTSVASVTLDQSTVSGINFLEVPDPCSNELAGSRSSSAAGKTCLPLKKRKLKNDSHASHSSSSDVTRTGSVTHESGPTMLSTVSCLKHINNERGRVAEDHEVGSSIKHKRLKLLPRRLFPDTEEKKARVSGSLSTFSGNDGSAGGTDACDESGSDVGLMCQKISKEFTRKIQNRSRKMDYFSKQSLKLAQKHLNGLKVQVQECRILHLEKFQQTIIEEIENFEKDSKALKQMEKDFTSFWSKQTQALSIYHQNEQRRIHCLKASFEKNVCHRSGYEDKLFTSEMNVMRDDMRAVQERLLKEMHEEELHSVRRGLESLFMAGAGPF